MSIGPVRAFIALGSNLGDRESLLVAAREALAAMPDVNIVGASRVYETAPVGPPDQRPYLNAVLVLETLLPARTLLERMLRIEVDHGRRRESCSERWGPRTLDLDLLLYGDHCILEPGLEVPHPKLHERPFVLEPLCELAAKRIHPRLGESFGVHLGRCRDPAAVAPWPAIDGWEVPGA